MTISSYAKHIDLGSRGRISATRFIDSNNPARKKRPKTRIVVGKLHSVSRFTYVS